MMAKFNALLNLRLRPKESQKPKMTALAERSKTGDLSSFSGVFRVTELNQHEKEALQNLLETFKENEDHSIDEDLKQLTAITAEVKGINNQAIILHGERIKKAQEVLKNYHEGAFTAWLFAAYGNRQTPYNFLQYYEFYQTLPPDLHKEIDKMPRQAIYTLASRDGEIEKKQEIVQNYKGQTKEELLNIIRKYFPLDEEDKRKINIARHIVSALKRAKNLLSDTDLTLEEFEKKRIQRLLNQVKKLIDNN